MKSILALFRFLLLGVACMAVFTQSSEAVETHQTAPNQFVDVNGTKYAYRAFGKPTGLPLILLQHFTGTLDNWDPVVTDGLAEHFWVVLLDGQGIGASGGQTPDTIDAMAHDTVGVIKALGFQKVNVLGFSMGGFIAQQMALDEPALINKLILAGTGPKGGQGIADIPTPLTASAAMSPKERKLYLFYNASGATRPRAALPGPDSSTNQRSGQGRRWWRDQRTVESDPELGASRHAGTGQAQDHHATGANRQWQQ